MVHAGTNGSDHVEPEPVDMFEIFRTERRRVRSEVKRGRRAARMVDDQPDVCGGGLRGALPGFAEQARLFSGRQRLGFADVNLRRGQPHGCLNHRVEDVDARHDHQSHGAAFTLGRGDHRRQEAALIFGGARPDGRVVRHVDADEPDGHRDNVPIAGGTKGRDEVRHHVRLAHGHEEVARPRVDLLQVHVIRREELEFVQTGRRRGRPRRQSAFGHDQCQRERIDQCGGGQRRRIENHEKGPARNREQKDNDAKRHQQQAGASTPSGGLFWTGGRVLSGLAHLDWLE